jgi:alpha-1,6-mannosyltransferase
MTHGLPTGASRSFGQLGGRHLVDVTMLFAPTSGGVRRYLLSKQRWLTDHTAARHTLLVPGDSHACVPATIDVIPGPAVRLVGGYRAPLAMRKFREVLARLEPDLIEVADPYHLAWSALRVARQRHVPIVTFCHSDVITITGSVAGRTASRAVAEYLGNLYARFDAVLAPSESVAATLRAAGVARVKVQPLGVDLQQFTSMEADATLRRTLGVPADARLLVFAGRLSREKHIGDLVEAVRRLGPPYHLLLIGGKRRVTRDGRVITLPYQSSARELARILASCDAFVHAGTQETFGLVALEAMACGLPVIAARAGALVELVDTSVGATFRPRDPADLARAVHELFFRDLTVLGRAARHRAAQRSWDVVMPPLAAFYARQIRSESIEARCEVLHAT